MLGMDMKVIERVGVELKSLKLSNSASNYLVFLGYSTKCGSGPMHLLPKPSKRWHFAVSGAAERVYLRCKGNCAF